MVAKISMVALISVPGGEGGMAAGTSTETITFCCAPAPSVNGAGTTLTHGATGAGPTASAIVCAALVGFRTGTTKVLDRPVLVWNPSIVCSPALLCGSVS